MDGLIIKKWWLDLILEGKKTLEIRGNNPKSHKDKKIALIESGTNKIRGTSKIYSVVRLWRETWFKDTQNFHCIPDDMESIITYKKLYGWWLSTPEVFEKPVEYKIKPGAVIWVKDVLQNERYDIKGKCKWKQDEIYGYYKTDCGREYHINEGTPGENDMNYCTYCGKILEEVSND